MDTKVAVVTGSNKGIGLGIVKGLCERFKGHVYLTSRDIPRGENAVKELNKIGLKPLYHQLDISDYQSVTNFRDYIKEKHSGIDILINNAAIAFLDNSIPLGTQAKKTMDVNYFSLISTCNILFPILKPNARVINLTSSLGHATRVRNEAIRRKFTDSNLTVDGLTDLVNLYIKAAEAGSSESEGWGISAYIMSKVAVSALTMIQSREFPTGMSVNCVHPGFVSTEMTGFQGHMTIERGTLASLYLALEAPQELNGVYMWHDKSIVDWNGTFPGYF